MVAAKVKYRQSVQTTSPGFQAQPYTGCGRQKLGLCPHGWRADCFSGASRKTIRNV